MARVEVAVYVVAVDVVVVVFQYRTNLEVTVICIVARGGIYDEI